MMGGEGPAVRFSQDNTTISSWAMRTGLQRFDSQQLQAVYSKAREFLLERGSMLIADYSWQEITTDMTAILHLSKNKRQLQLPTLFASFLEASKADDYSKMFCIFNAKRDRTNNNLFIDSPTPLADIFYLLQTLLPGMLLIYRIDEYDDFGEEERIRALPPAAWVEEHKGTIQTIFDDHTRYDRLLAAAGDRKLAEKTIGNYMTYYDNEEEETPDFTACDKECGYCGACPYE